MTVTIRSAGKWLTLSREGVEDLVHEVPRKNKFFKEELRQYREEIRCWLRGEECGAIDAFIPLKLSFYRRILMREAVKVLQGSGLPLITTYSDNTTVIR